LVRGRWDDLEWQVGRHCNGGDCIQVARLDDQVAMRCSADPSNRLIFTATDWMYFTTDIRSGKYDHMR
jgi:hypothetical protein